MSVDPQSLPYRPCVGIMALNRQGRVWIGRRADAPDDAEGPGHWWQMPQGGLDEGEDPRAGALRELYEETNMRSVRMLAEAPGWLTYDLPRHLVGVAWKGRYRGQKQKWFAVLFEGRDAEIDIVHPAGGHHEAEFDAWRWAELDEVTSLVVPFKRVVYAQVAEAFADLPSHVRGGA